MLTVYGVYRSRATRPIWLLGEIGMEWRHVPVIQTRRLASAGAGEAPLHTTSPDFAALNPMCEIPCIEDDGMVLTESLAITWYIARRYGGTFGPQTQKEEARMAQWMLLAGTAVEPPALTILGAGDDAARDKATAQLAKPFAWLDRHLADHRWLVADRFTVADVMLAECVRYVQGHPPALAPYPHLADWLSRCQARPAWQAMWARRNAEPA